MKKRLNKNSVVSICVSFVLALEILMLIDAVVVFRGGEISLTAAAGLMGILTVTVLGLFHRHIKSLIAVILMIPALVITLGICSFFCWKQFSAGAGYQGVDSGKKQIYGDRKVMLIVPHQDDDLNILGGVLEEYARYGSELFPVFVTNGDFNGLDRKSVV